MPQNEMQNDNTGDKMILVILNNKIKHIDVINGWR